jgi:putative transposase
VFHQGRFLCRAVCQELAGSTVPLRDIVSARNRRRRELRQTLVDRRRVVDSLLEAKRWDDGEKRPEEASQGAMPLPVKLKRYACDE